MKKKVISCLLVASLLSGCGSNNVNTIVEEESEVAVKETEAMSETESEEDAIIEILDDGVVINSVTDDKTQLEMCIYMYVQNNSDRVLEDVEYQVTLFDENDESVLLTTILSTASISPHEIAILSDDVSMSVDDFYNSGTLSFKNINAKYSSKNIVPQSDVEFSNVNVKKNDYTVEFLGIITNNGQYTIDNLSTVTLVAKVDGKPVTIAKDYLDADINPGGTYTFDLYAISNNVTNKTDYDSCEYDIYLEVK